MILNALGQVPPKTKLFLVEGDSEAEFVQAILSGSGNKDAAVFSFKGINNLGTVLKSISGSPGISNLKLLGLMLDADSDFDSRLRSVMGYFSNYGLDVLEGDIRHSAIKSHGACSLGIFISPGEARAGRIENLALDEIKSSAVWPCLDGYINCVEAVLKSKLDEKAIVQTYISTKRGNLCGVGRAFSAKILDVNNSAYDLPRGMIQRLLQAAL